MKQATILIRQYPSILFFCIFQSLLQIGIGILFFAIFLAITLLEWSPWIYLYVLLSYIWVTLTFGYVTYLTIAGLAASWYFLNDTPQFPQHPVLTSLKRAYTTSFGSACLSGFLMAFIETLKAIMNTKDGNKEGITGVVLVIFRCVSLCILSILECFVKWICRYSLIYCAMFGVPFKEGCRRWAELSANRFVDVVMGGVCVRSSLGYNQLLFAVGGGFLGFGIGYKAAVIENEEYWMGIMVALISALLTFGFLDVMSTPILTMSDTLLIGFAEAPEKLRSSAAPLYDLLAERYRNGLAQRIANASR
jgi:hypothetical protein